MSSYKYCIVYKPKEEINEETPIAIKGFLLKLT